MIPVVIKNELGEWHWIVRPRHYQLQGDTGIEQAHSVGPTETVDPAPMIRGPWWGERPWFETGLSNIQSAFLAEAGFSTRLIEMAGRGLRRLFGEDVCPELAKRHETRMLIAPLYQPYVPFLKPLLTLGCDLVDANVLRAPDHRDHLDRSIVITQIGPS